MQSECASQPESQHESERGADMDDDDGVASVMSGSVLHGARSVNSSNSLKKRKSRSGIDFRAIYVGFTIHLIHGLGSPCLDASGQTTRDATRRGKPER